MYPTSYADYWAYAAAAQAQYAQGQTAYGSAQTSYQYPYGAYFGNGINGGGQQQQYNPYTSYAQAYSRGSSQQRNSMLNWQQPYQGPLRGDTQATTGAGVGQPQAISQATSSQSQHYRDSPQMAYPSFLSNLANAQSSTSSTPTANSASNITTPAAATPTSYHSGQTPLPQPQAMEDLTALSQSFGQALNSQPQQQAMKDLAALSSLEPSQIAEILLGNPQLRDLVLAAVNQAKLAGTV